VLGKDFLARLSVEFGEIACVHAQRDVALFYLGEAEVLKDFGNRKQLIHLELQGARDFRQIGLAVVRGRGDRFHQTGHHIRGNRRQPASQVQLVRMLRRPRGRTRRHLGVDIVDHLSKG
jgi:hypothetical protein